MGDDIKFGVAVWWETGERSLAVSSPFRLTRGEDGNYHSAPEDKFNAPHSGIWKVHHDQSLSSGCQMMAIDSPGQVMLAVFDTEGESNVFVSGLMIGSGSQKHLISHRLRRGILQEN